MLAEDLEAEVCGVKDSARLASASLLLWMNGPDKGAQEVNAPAALSLSPTRYLSLSILSTPFTRLLLPPWPSPIRSHYKNISKKEGGRSRELGGDIGQVKGTQII